VIFDDVDMSGRRFSVMMVMMMMMVMVTVKICCNDYTDDEFSFDICSNNSGRDADHRTPISQSCIHITACHCMSTCHCLPKRKGVCCARTDSA
jgi:hypothetical protein